MQQGMYSKGVNFSFKIGNLKVVGKCGLISCVEFKVKVRELIDF
jgi:hypothetical protein